jgi:hypothetical protein
VSTSTSIVACVCRTGGRYTPAVVRWLQAQVTGKLRTPHTFHCLTDKPDSMPGGIALQHSWTTWWPKLELFRPGLWPDGATVLYVDLDAVFLRPFCMPEPPPAGDLGVLAFGPNWFTPCGSGVMLWRTPLNSPYEWFAPMADEVMRRLSGDQDAIFAGVLSTRHSLHPIPGAVAQLSQGTAGIPVDKPAGTIWCTAGNGPKSWETPRSWIPRMEKEA